MSDDMYQRLVKLIVSVHKELIGPYALKEANKVEGLVVSEDLATITVTGDGKETINKLVKQYQSLFGSTSIQMCREAQRELLPDMSRDDLPELLR